MQFNKLWSYSQALRELTDLSHQVGMVFGLESTQSLHHLAGSPAQTYRTVHVAGTNGKGSVAAKIAQGLQQANYKTGLYTSPHLLDYCERIQINSVNIRSEEFASLAQEIFRLRAELGSAATAFEVLTIMGFLHFCRQRVDVAVIEVGLGGRLDSTNIIVPEVSVITSIGFDHVHLLGHTLTDIAKEKAGIVKPGVPVIAGPNVPIDVFREVCKSNRADLTVVEAASVFETVDQENSRLAKAVLQRLQSSFPRLTPNAIDSGIAFRLKGRKHVFQVNSLKGRITIVLDTGHNVSALSRLFFDLTTEYPASTFRVVLGMSKDKQVFASLEEVMKFAKCIHLVSTESNRLLPFPQLRQVAESIDARIVGVSGLVEDVLGQVIDMTDPEEVLVICGSFFIMEKVSTVLGTRVKW